MCGIYGITYNEPNIVKNYIDKCRHRGPDGSQIWSDDYVCLGHNLLSITSDPSVGTQPWHCQTGILVYNGEVFNYNDLVKKFSNQWQPNTSCDTELLAYLIDHYDINHVNEQIDSMHAYAFYNQKEKTLILSRDHVGIKPLYYLETNKGLAFGSEIKGLIDIQGSSTIDELAAATMSYCGINPTENTLFKNIKKVMPGETLVYDLVQKRFISKNRQLIFASSDQSFDAEEFKHEAHETVKMSTLGIRKFGLFLSGGLDSTLVGYELNKVLDTVYSFTNVMNPNVVIGEDHNDDANMARRFAKDFGFVHKEIEMTPDSVKECWDQSVYMIEEPIYAMSLPMYYKTNQILSQNGIVVTMAGDMGDELLGGYQKYWKLKKETFKTHRDLIWKWMHRIKRPIELTNKVSAHDILDVLCKTIPEQLWNPEDPINSYMSIDCITQVPEEFFSRNDKFGMAFGMEGRFPLATKRFMKYCLGIHSDYKIGENKNDTKLLTKIAYKNVLPDYIINKQKTGWTVPLIYWLGTNKNLEDFAMQYMNKEDCLKTQISMDNWNNKKTRVVSWLMRSWAQSYNLT